jgi:hypothetical protein
LALDIDSDVVSVCGYVWISPTSTVIQAASRGYNTIGGVVEWISGFMILKEAVVPRLSL